ncbi:GNAT family N-acetyltransferase [Flavobacterium chungangense]|uniref:GNAT family N-acetyltransferase n=1 Tax=Flavobacterium chungangense TaxID=554283 RepID=A0A6V6Z9E6_9FLAO|nr:GNAT family N-acetyltransferase [Flavobacterium chungangense]CAD0008064.1 GNAT family N-acetyltransferase [Flavobacterium chungangense]
MKNTDLIKDNIDNLTGFWKTIGTPFLAYYKNDSIAYCKIKNSGWPNKLWFKEDITSEDLSKIIQILHKNPGLIIPYWDIFESNSNQLLEQNSFEIKTEQMGMFLKLNQKFTLQNNLTFKKVTTEEDAKIWADVYPNAFGYVISKEILIQDYQNVHFYLVAADKKPIGTFMLYQTGKDMGIHGVGVIPEMRRKGFAEEIMKFAMNLSIDLNAETAHLQASAMGKDIYTRLGFEDLFLIKNYVLNSNT